MDDYNDNDGDLQVIVRVLGANLYSPVFSQRFYLAEVQENAPPGSKVIQVISPSYCSQDTYYIIFTSRNVPVFHFVESYSGQSSLILFPESLYIPPG